MNPPPSGACRASRRSPPEAPCRSSHSRNASRSPGATRQRSPRRRTVIQGGGRVFGVRLGAEERRYDIGNFEAYFRAFVEFALADERHGRELRTYLEQLLDVHHA